MALKSVRYLQSFQAELSDHITTAIAPDREDALESAGLLVALLERLEADQSVFPPIACDRIGRYRALIDEVNSAIGRQHDGAMADGNSAGPLRISELEELEILRGRLARAIDDLDKIQDDDLRRKLLDEVVNVDREWRSACVTAMSEARASKVSVHPDEPGETYSRPAEVTTETMTTYLRQRFPEMPDLQVTTVRRLAGGRSKDSYALTLQNAPSLPPRLVMRQDANRHGLNTAVVDEFAVLSKVTQYGVTAPRTVLLEDQHTALGNPFYLMEYVEGEPSGTYYVGFFDTDPANRRSVVLDVARTLGTLHSIEPEKVLPGHTPHHQKLIEDVRFHRNQWRECAVEPSPMFSAGFAWLEEEVAAGIGGAAVLHGDVAVHNMLVKDGRLTALLDWELFGVGDPAADLAYFRPVIEDAVPWADFMAVYKEHGGTDVDERRLRMFAIWGFLRNASIIANAAETFHREPASRLEVGYMSAAVAYLEEQVSPLLESIWSTQAG